jgi:hypothetical protein
MILQSIIDKGVHRKVYGKLCEDLVFTYGMQHVISLTNLSRLGLFYEQGAVNTNYNFSDIKKELKLIS